MNFVSSTFLLFFIITFSLWWFLPSTAARRYLVFANLVFYTYWFPPHVSLLFIVGLINYLAARSIKKYPTRSKSWLIFNLIFSLVALAYFKYANFFLGVFKETLEYLSIQISAPTLHIILPLGISFYTFKGISYCIDVYRGRLEPPGNFWDYLLYLSFFPHLAAGPIVRAIDFLPQLPSRPFPQFDDWQFAIYRITRGLFLKLIIADHIAKSVDSIFSAPYAGLSSVTAWLGAFFFGVQIFCDFAGYSDIAIGISRLFGFKTLENFNNPYLSSSLSEFWRRWHISMSSWFRDYVYFPLARSRWTNEKLAKILRGPHLEDLRASVNTLIMFFLSGLWHGANWTFIFWGLLHGFGIVFERLTGLYAFQQRPEIKYRVPKMILGMVTILFIMFVWVPFRAPNISAVFSYWHAMFFGGREINFVSSSVLNGLLWLSVFFIYQTLMGFKEKVTIAEKLAFLQRAEAWIYFAALLLIPSQATDFIYFRF